jgi:hypothetical protein
MANSNYAINLFNFTVNGRQITDWGVSADPYTDEAIDPKRVLNRGMGGQAMVTSRDNPGRRVTIMLLPGSADSSFMQSLYESGANITVGGTQIGTLETIVGTNGIVVNDQPVRRAGMNPSDDGYVLEFNNWTALKGGN